MIFTIKLLKPNDLKAMATNKIKSHRVLYADHNTLNYMYESKLTESDLMGITLYPGSLVMHFILNKYLKIKTEYVNLTDYQAELLDFALENKLKLFFFGDYERVVDKIKDKLIQSGVDKDLMRFMQGYTYSTEKVLESYKEFEPDIHFLGLGVSRQELWLTENKVYLNSGLTLAVGGWFRYLSGESKRAPLFMRKLYLEWLHKMTVEFLRVSHRYFYGIPLFLFRVLTGRIKFVVER